LQVPVAETQLAAAGRSFAWLVQRGNTCKVIPVVLLVASLRWSKGFLHGGERNCSTHCNVLTANPLRAKVVLRAKLLGGVEGGNQPHFKMFW